MHRGGRVAVAGRVLHVSTMFRRSLTTLGVRAGSPGYRAVSATLHALASGDLPGAGDYESDSHRGRPTCVAYRGTTSGSSTDSTMVACSS